MPTFVDICQDGVRVGTNIGGDDQMYFGDTVTVTMPDTGGLYTRAAAFGNTHVGVTRTENTDRCIMVRETGQVLDVGPQVGNYGQAVMPSPDKSRLYLVSMESTTQYRKIVFDTTFAEVSNDLIAIPPPQTFTEGFLDVTAFGVPIFTSERRTITVNGVDLAFPVERNGVWLGVTPTAPDQVLLVSPTGQTSVIYDGLAFEPHLTLSNDNSTLYISFRANVVGPDGEFGQFRDAAAGMVLQSLYVPKSQPYLNPGNHPTKPWLDFFDRIAAFVGQPVNLAHASGILDPGNGGTGNNSGGGGAALDAEYLVAAVHAGLSAERLVEDTATIEWDFTVPGVAKANGTAATTGSWIPLVDGSEPPNFITDGAGHLILVAYP